MSTGHHRGIIHPSVQCSWQDPCHLAAHVNAINALAMLKSPTLPRQLRFNPHPSLKYKKRYLVLSLQTLTLFLSLLVILTVSVSGLVV